jgi:hypothetical protein
MRVSLQDEVITTDCDEENSLDVSNNSSSLRQNSPFTDVFQAAISDIDANCEVETTDCCENNMYSPASFSVIKDLIHLYPLWSAVLQTSPSRFGKDASSTETVSLEPRCLTNGTVESHFKSVKHGRLGNRNRVRPGIFLENELAFIKGKMNEQLLPKPKPRKRRTEKNNQSSSVEKWRRRKKLPNIPTNL